MNQMTQNLDKRQQELSQTETLGQSISCLLGR